MALLPILEFPDPRLRIVAKPVVPGDPTIKKLVENMLETMYAAPGIGLAATQVNVHKRVVVIDVSENQDQPQVFINPEIQVLDETVYQHEEGCLSVPGFYEEISRPQHIYVKALDVTGQAFETSPEGILAVCIQHEADHLAGKLFVDHISSIKRQRIRKKLVKQHREKHDSKV